MMRVSGGNGRLTRFEMDNKVEGMATSVSKIQIGQLWKKDGTDDTYLVTRVYSEALSTMATLRKREKEKTARLQGARAPRFFLVATVRSRRKRGSFRPGRNLRSLRS